MRNAHRPTPISIPESIMSSKSPLILIAAVDGEGGLGRSGTIPWDCPEDRAFFRTTTMGCPTLMGRVTFDSIGRPLPGRPCAVWTHAPQAVARDGVFASASLQKLLDWGRAFGRPVFAIGGATLYKALLPSADAVCLSRIPGRFACDAFFPPMTGFVCIKRTKHSTFVEEWWQKSVDATRENVYN